MFPIVPSLGFVANTIPIKSSYRKSFSNWPRPLNTSDLFANKSTRRWNDTDGRRRESAKCTKSIVSSVKFPECKDSVHVSILPISNSTTYCSPLNSCPSPKGDESKRLHVPRRPQHPSGNPSSSCILHPQQERGGIWGPGHVRWVPLFEAPSGSRWCQREISAYITGDE